MQCLVDKGVKQRNAASAKDDEQSPVPQDKVALHPQRRQRERQQNDERHKPAPQIEAYRRYLIVNKAPDNEITCPRQRCNDQQQVRQYIRRSICTDARIAMRVRRSHKPCGMRGRNQCTPKVLCLTTCRIILFKDHLKRLQYFIEMRASKRHRCNHRRIQGLVRSHEKQPWFAELIRLNNTR